MKVADIGILFSSNTLGSCHGSIVSEFFADSCMAAISANDMIAIFFMINIIG